MHTIIWLWWKWNVLNEDIIWNLKGHKQQQQFQINFKTRWVSVQLYNSWRQKSTALILSELLSYPLYPLKPLQLHNCRLSIDLSCAGGQVDCTRLQVYDSNLLMVTQSNNQTIEQNHGIFFLWFHSGWHFRNAQYTVQITSQGSCFNLGSLLTDRAQNIGLQIKEPS